MKKDPSCDFTGLYPGTDGYIKAEFSFSNDWIGTVRVAKFCSVLGWEYTPSILENGKTCLIPAEALKKKSFTIQIIGQDDKKKLTTNKITIKQNGGM